MTTQFRNTYYSSKLRWLESVPVGYACLRAVMCLTPPAKCRRSRTPIPAILANLGPGSAFRTNCANRDIVLRSQRPVGTWCGTASNLLLCRASSILLLGSGRGTFGVALLGDEGERGAAVGVLRVDVAGIGRQDVGDGVPQAEERREVQACEVARKVLAVSVAAVSGEVHHLDRGRHLGVVLEEAEGEIVDLSSAPLLA